MSQQNVLLLYAIISVKCLIFQFNYFVMGLLQDALCMYVL